ncbi:MAG TPA: ComF family protein [Chloroflexota bacterium]|nr:ComF family protein [Chloroflexota bacterium]
MTPRRPSALARGWTAALAALFPARCLGCGRRGVAFCAACWASLPRLRPPYCPRCSRPQRAGTRCRDCQRAGPALSAVRAACVYSGPLGLAIRRLKYSRERHLAEPLAGLLQECLAARPLAVDVLVPVPLDAARAQERGYNQATLLAAPVAAALGVPLAPAGLRRARPTRPQVGLTARERRANVRGAFTCPNSASVVGRRLLVVDDVMTTGATLEACAEALVAAGAAGVWGLVVARDLPQQSPRSDT